ncbi:MAG: SUF system NifU family Fe-S cluster assembly protein [Ignavibacteriaceae bacterium]|jgi:nitrogen fixation NifU-like protein|nr:SUF system NifU family Fe-S cluster assembly protein [Ignavibacteriaceae bacterium]HPO56623.1 SUF system NifU family Fe-S cluster assembly protein [Ignavibacteriaceae bacterium]
MDQELRELYQQVILDHNKTPRNFKKLEEANHFAEGFNPLCGDHIDIYVLVDEKNMIKEVSFQGSGCAISKSSASLMTTIVKGKKIEEAEEIFDKFQKLVTGVEISEAEMEQLGKLAIFQGVKEFPARVKCASLAWHTLNAALKNEEQSITTE